MSGLFLNFCECRFSSGTIQIYKTEYSDYDSYKKLIDTNPDIYYYRDGSSLYYWSNSNQEISGKDAYRVTIDMDSHPNIICRLIELKIKNLFEDKGVDIYLDKFSNSWAIINKKDLFGDSGLGIYRQINITSNSLVYGSNIIFGFCISVNLKHQFKFKRDEFIERGIACSDLKGKDDIIYANKTAIKRYTESVGIAKEYEKLKNTLISNPEECKTIKETIKWISEEN